MAIGRKRETPVHERTTRAGITKREGREGDRDTGLRPDAERAMNARLAVVGLLLVGAACAAPPAPRRHVDPAREEQKAYPAGPPPTTPGEAGDVPSIPPVKP